MNKTVITCKCKTVYIAEEHPAAGGAENEIGRWHTCPGCLTTGVILSEEFRRRNRMTDLRCPRCRQWCPKFLKPSFTDTVYYLCCGYPASYSYDEIACYLMQLCPPGELSPRPAREIVKQREEAR